jgi:MinD-like ATPase involved in chromosome partitioning or flagellar assembly
MNPIEEITRRIESKQRLIDITNAEMTGLRDALKIVEWADAISIQRLMDRLNAIPRTDEVESGG